MLEYNKVEYTLTHRDRPSEVTVYNPNKDKFGGSRNDQGVTINWVAHGSVSIEDAKIFAEALNFSIELAEKLEKEKA